MTERHALADRIQRAGRVGALLSLDVFGQICEGPVTGEVMGALRRVENTQRKRLLLGFAAELRRLDARRAVLPDFDDAWRLLLEVEDAAPDVVDDVIMFPSVGLWFRRALEQIVVGFVDTPPNRAVIGVVHAVAAAVAIRAGIECSTRVPVVQGVVSLPTVGQFEVTVDESVDFVLLTSSGPRMTLSLAGVPLIARDDESSDSFRSTRRHRSAAAGVPLDVVFDDTDPHRGFTDRPAPPDPLTDLEFARWREQLDGAWSVLVDWNSGYAAELSEGLTSLVPLTREGRIVGASSAAAFGAIALSEKPSVDDLADALVHELQHSKLNAVFELVSLHDADDRYFYAPWRDDPRPLNGVLHGIYAFTSVVEFWCARRKRVPAQRAVTADFTFVLRALQVRLAIEGIAARAHLNEWGRLFLDTLSRRLTACEVESTAADRNGPVARIVEDHRVLWRVRHVRSDPGDIAVLADAWFAGRTAPAGFRVRGEVADHAVPGASNRAALLRAQVLNSAGDGITENVDEADLAYVRGDIESAADAYRRRLLDDTGDDQAWAGLALTVGSASLAREPEVVRALHREIAARRGTRSDPVRLAGWMDASRS